MLSIYLRTKLNNVLVLYSNKYIHEDMLLMWWFMVSWGMSTQAICRASWSCCKFIGVFGSFRTLPRIISQISSRFSLIHLWKFNCHWRNTEEILLHRRITPPNRQSLWKACFSFNSKFQGSSMTSSSPERVEIHLKRRSYSIFLPSLPAQCRFVGGSINFGRY